MSYTYDLKDRVVKVKDGQDQETTIQYDAVGQVVQITHPSQSTQYDWDEAGRLVKETTKTQAGTTTLQMQFDGLNRVVQKQVTHQGAGASKVASPLQTTRYLYDNAGRTSAISQTIGANASANNTLVTRYEWDARGRLIAKHLPRPMQATATQGGASSTDYFAASNAGVTQLYSYDLLDQLTQIQYRQTTSSASNASAGNLIDQIDYTYDKAGQRIGRKQQNGQALPETPMQAQYNQANRLTQLTLYPNTPQAKTYVLDYDLEGNLIKKQNSTDTSCTQDCTEYVWDANNRLAQLKINGQTTAVYSYDAQGRRVEASISTSNNGTAQTNTVQYIYEGNQAVGEVRNGQLSHSLLTGLFIDEHLARTAIATNGQTQSQAQLTDALGSVIALANVQTSGINTSYNYSPYGQTQATGENSSNNQQYTGREAGIEGEAGLYYYRARYYDPVLKRFISEDPIRLGGGLNVYAYVEGNPVSFSDPSGNLVQAIPLGLLTIGVIWAIYSSAPDSDLNTNFNWDFCQPDQFGVDVTPKATNLSFLHDNKLVRGGTCSPNDFDNLEGRKEEECAEAAKFGGCKSGEIDIYKASQWGKCAKSRENVMNKCFDGGDAGHRKSSYLARENQLRCLGNKFKGIP